MPNSCALIANRQKRFTTPIIRFSRIRRVSAEKGMREVVDFMLQQQKGKARGDVNASRMIDESLIDELQRDGFFKKLEARL